jgi:TatD DNase family protein
MIDSHCHLDLCPDPDAAVDAELAALITVGTDADRNELALALAGRHANVWAAIGLHPNGAAAASSAGVRARIESQARGQRVVAIGETGFDTHWQEATLEQQRYAFDWQAQLARELDLPLILHVRDSEGADDASRAAIRALQETGWHRGILHCCNGHPGLLEAALELGWFVSFAGNLTYPKATVLHDAARVVPLNRLLVETDSPYLAPVPMRGKRNTPGFVRHTAAFLAELRALDPVQLEAVTDANAVRAFSLPLADGFPRRKVS